MPPDQQQGGGGFDAAGLAKELVSGGPDLLVPLLQAIDRELQSHDADLKRLVLSLDAKGEKAAAQEMEMEEEVPMNEEAPIEAPTPQGRQRLSLR